MEISIKTVNGKSINIKVDDTSDTIDLKICGPTRQLVLRLGPDSGSDQEATVIQILVLPLGGETFILDVEESDTIENVMAKIHVKKGIATHHMRLNFQHKPLEHGRTIADYGIKTGSNLMMTWI